MEGLVQMPSGAWVRGRRIGQAPEEDADFLLALAPGPPYPWLTRRIRWPDFWIPKNRAEALAALREGIERANAGEMVEVACRGGQGRTGTALAAMAILDGLPPGEAVAWVREHYSAGAVEMPWQAWWVRSIRRPGPSPSSSSDPPG